eukprot:766933-Hanusia_phi.AAC.1
MFRHFPELGQAAVNFLSPIAKSVASPLRHSPNPGSSTPASCVKAQQSHVGSTTKTAPERDALVKVTFQAIHEDSPEDSAMYITGSLPSLGSWDLKRARKMARGPGGTWCLAIYIPEKAEFLYQYLLLRETASPDEDPVVLWEGGLERKCKVNDNQSPSRSMLLSDDTRGEGNLIVAEESKSMPSPPPQQLEFVTNEAVPDLTASEKEQLEILTREREMCQNELQKLKDIIGFAAVGSEYRARASYLPETGALYDTVRQVQAFMRSQADRVRQAERKEEASPAVDKTKELEKMRLQLEDSERERVEAVSRYETQMQELKEYYQSIIGKLDSEQDGRAAEREKQEQSKLMLQSSVRVVAGNLESVKKELGGLKEAAEELRSFLPNFNSLQSMMTERMQEVTGRLEEETSCLSERLVGEVKERKRLHNLVLDLKGNIRVFCRARPARSSSASPSVVSFPAPNELLLEAGGKSQSFSYDATFGPQSQQDEIFRETQPLVVSVLDGYHVCILAYGQTGSGKTHTMQGSASSPGVNTRALRELFALAEERGKELEYKIKISLIEIYNETIRDLLEPLDEKGEEKKLDVKLGQDGGTCVPGVLTSEVASMEQVMHALQRGEQNRSVAGTDMNEHSSRSHMVLTVYTQVREKKGRSKLGKWQGEERRGRTGTGTGTGGF